MEEKKFAVRWGITFWARYSSSSAFMLFWIQKSYPSPCLSSWSAALSWGSQGH